MNKRDAVDEASCDPIDQPVPDTRLVDYEDEPKRPLRRRTIFACYRDDAVGRSLRAEFSRVLFGEDAREGSDE